MAKGKGKKGRSGGGGSGGGGLLSMRSGMRRLAGVEKDARKKPVHPVWNVVSWVLVAALVAAALFLFARRFGA